MTEERHLYCRDIAPVGRFKVWTHSGWCECVAPQNKEFSFPAGFVYRYMTHLQAKSRNKLREWTVK